MPPEVIWRARKINFYDSLINVLRNLGEKTTAVLAGNFNGLARSIAENYEDWHEGYGYAISYAIMQLWLCDLSESIR